MSSRRVDARSIALLYAVFGVGWILVTDLALAVVYDQSVGTVEIAKGLVFVAASSSVIYWLVSRTTGQLETTRADLKRANRERAIYDRILRHNFRNGLQVVGGNAELALAAEGAERERYIQNVEEHCEGLLDLCRDAREFSALIDSAPSPQRVDLAEKVREAAAVGERYPDADLEVDSPSEAPAMAVESIDVAFRHAIENACEHAGETPTVRVGVTEAASTVEVRITDDGEGVPESERAALEADLDRPLRHPSSLGLRVIQWLVDRSGGDLSFEDGGRTVRLSFPETETHKVASAPDGDEPR